MGKLSYQEQNEPYVVGRLLSVKILNSWEKEFLKGIQKNISDGGSLSDKQKKILSDLWEKI